MKPAFRAISTASLFSLSIALGAGFLALPATRAATLTNADRVAHSIMVIKDNVRQSHELRPGGLLEELCQDGCIVRIDGDPDKDFILEGSERVSIEGGLLYYDGEVAPKRDASEANKAKK